MIELKNCPFCGKITPVKIVTAAETGECKNGANCIECGYYCVVCDYSDNGCGASSRYARSPEEAAEAWNRRTL